jgi:hypothetical protein
MLMTALFAGAPAAAADLLGAIRDPARLPVAAARVRLVDESRRIEREAIADNSGAYHFFDLPAGAYRARVDAPGFREEAIELALSVGERRIRDFDLQLANRRDVVQVRADAALLQTATGSTSFLVAGRDLTSLPLDGRNYIPLIALSPGVMLPPGSVLPRINGSRPRTSEYLYDGISVLQPEPGQAAWYPVIDAIQEFRVRTNSYSAEYGRSNGGVIEVETRAGGDQWRGTLFEFFRHEALNARKYFSREAAKPPFRRNQYGFAAGGPLRKNKTFLFADWQGARLRTGATRISTVPLGAERAGQFSTPVFDPAATRRTAAGFERDPFPGNRIPESRWDPAAARLMARYPTPNVTEGGRAAANNYRRTASETTDTDQFDLRLDHYFSDRHRVFGRWSRLQDRASPAAPLPDGSGAIASGVIGDTLTRADGFAVEHSWTLSPASANQFRAGWTRRGFQRSSMQGAPATAASGIPGMPLTAFPNVFPTFEITGYQQLGPPPSSNARFTTSVTQIVDAFSIVRAAHTFKLGADVRREQMDALQPPSPTGRFQFTPALTSALAANGAPAPSTGSSMASFLVGAVQAFSIDAQQAMLRPRANIAEFYIQDDWRASPRLMLNLGVRYTLNFPSTEANDHAAVFDLNTQKLRFAGRDGQPRSARKLEWGDFGPRLGFAFRATNSFVIRGGYGLTWIEQAGITTPFTTPLFPFIQTVTARSLDSVTPAFLLSRGPDVRITDPNPDSGLGQGVFAVQSDNGSGYAQQWNLTLQKTFGDNWSVEAGYAASKLTRLGTPDVNLNQLRVEQLGLGAQLTELVENPFYGEIPDSSPLGAPLIARQQLLRPYPRFTTVSLYRNNVGHSTYHSLETRLARRFSAGFTLTVAYTYSKLIDDAGAVFDSAILTGPVLNYEVADSFDRRLEKDESTGSIPHVFSAGFVWELPFGGGRLSPASGWLGRVVGGWTVAGLVRLQSGAPVAVTQATNYNAAFGFGVQRPNRTRNPELPAGERSVERWFDIAAFAPAPQFTIGNSSRNPVRGPGYQAADLMLGKSIALSERCTAEFRAEAFNVTNTPPLSNPNGNFGTSAFGAITTALDPRVFELAAKLHF